ncbi:uncharacterized protein BP01DRAFT_359592 [Aspergillus saccharolyticus JOP 1030-1]|uniref:Malate dehydrogenase n=1 Tax=Aspergillus saccharolyticus JOP 1030-1 TaxID=1450539 RepID=A0A318ZFF2_9EURO|nr:hypothetical protein BP01DRAFT_359592 [Aspergillus saccharolyticus JOP 1030-1]PYH42340.1 hypothetical protein BP01DRAFT_359592 [Aspergillus saccharolyticus JOP 1030-1]
MRPSLCFFACFAAGALAAPTWLDDIYDYSQEMASFLGEVSKEIEKVAISATTCDTSKISLPSYASSLPSPSGLTPVYVAVGRGTQNYTCATSSSNSTPVAIGAVARLYNATCIAANYPTLLQQLPDLAYQISLPSDEEDALPPANLDLLGHHYFQGTSTPVFNLDTTVEQQNGIAITQKQESIDAPSDAVKGSTGAVAWLYLTAIDGTVGDYKSVYRVTTVSGAAPDTCKGMQSTFTVQYAALYYFYGES